ncbi:AMP-binding protein [Nonlabens xiamenensis]|uniref:AMP-binding protein n=1 Tax=Nonlabens xiamenensis TaxID=2341043 RepID=UPI000F60A798|nr:AMP-binding protein [Nonlabens xiamenensis]
MIPKIHPTFKLNGHRLDHDGVMTVAYSYVKEGEYWERQIGDFLLSWLDDFEVVTVHTSGSTGVPKEYKLDKQHMINSALMTGAFFDMGEEKEVLCCLPLSYIAGKMMMVRAMTLGWDLDLVEPSTTPLHKAEKRYDFTAMSPLQLSRSLDHIHKTRKVIIGGGPVSPTLIKQLQGKHTKAYHTYGMTETCSHIAVREIYPLQETFFKPLPQVKLSKNEEGCLLIDAPHLTSSTLVTNDLVEFNKDGGFQVMGRKDDVINSGTVKIHPLQVEQKLAQDLSARFFIAGMADNELGQRVVLVVEGEEQEVQSAMKGLSKFERPKQVYFVPKFVETHTGKIDKRSTLDQVEAS